MPGVGLVDVSINIEQIPILEIESRYIAYPINRYWLLNKLPWPYVFDLGNNNIYIIKSKRKRAEDRNPCPVTIK